MARTGVAIALAALAVTGCRDSRSNDAAAVIDGTEVSRQRYENIVRLVAANPELFGIEEDLATGTIAADAGRNVLRVLLLDTAMEQYLADQGEAVTDADRQPVLDSIGPTGQDVPAEVLELDVELQASRAALGRLASRSGESRAAYEASPADIGLLCVRHILLETEEEAQEVIAELDAGADFAQLAGERSIEPAAATSGGAIELQPGQPCIAASDAQTQLDPVFTAAGLQAIPGTPTEPVQTSFGWHVILARPYDEVAVAVDPVIGQRQFEEQLQDADVVIDPRYGRWDSAVLRVVALDAPPVTTTPTP